MVAEVHNHYTQSVSGRKDRNCNYKWESFQLSAVESAQLHVRQHLYKQIEHIYGNCTTWKFQSLIMSRDAQLHVHASSLPSLTVKRRNVVFSISHPAHSQSQPHQQSTPRFVWTEILIWNLVNTLELDAPCRGLKTTAFKSLIITVAAILKREACMLFEKINNRSLFNVVQYYCKAFKRSTVHSKNRDMKKIEVILHCSNLLVLLHKL